MFLILHVVAMPSNANAYKHAQTHTRAHVYARTHSSVHARQPDGIEWKPVVVCRLLARGSQLTILSLGGEREREREDKKSIGL